jgi:hypothetical protein
MIWAQIRFSALSLSPICSVVATPRTPGQPYCRVLDACFVLQKKSGYFSPLSLSVSRVDARFFQLTFPVMTFSDRRLFLSISGDSDARRLNNFLVIMCTCKPHSARFPSDFIIIDDADTDGAACSLLQYRIVRQSSIAVEDESVGMKNDGET